MESRTAPVERVRWRWILPLVASGITFLLLMRARYESSPVGFNAPSQGLEGILNFPTIVLEDNIDALMLGLPPQITFVIRAYIAKSLLVVGFWVWIGWLIDTRHRWPQPTSGASRAIWTCGYALAIAFCVYCVVWLNWSSYGGPQFTTVTLLSHLTHEKGLNWLCVWAFDSAVGSLWFVAGGIYFFKRGTSLWRPSLRRSASFGE